MNVTIDSHALIKLLLLLAHADEQYHANEEKFIRDVVKKNNVDDKDYTKILNEVTAENRDYKLSCLEILKKISNEENRKTALKALSDLAAADYIIHEDEILLLQLIADEWGMYKKRLSE